MSQNKLSSVLGLGFGLGIGVRVGVFLINVVFVVFSPRFLTIFWLIEIQNTCYVLPSFAWRGVSATANIHGCSIFPCSEQQVLRLCHLLAALFWVLSLNVWFWQLCDGVAPSYCHTAFSHPPLTLSQSCAGCVLSTQDLLKWSIWCSLHFPLVEL